MEDQGPKIKRFITTQLLGSGWAAVELWWNTEDFGEHNGFWEPWITGIGRYATEEEAIVEAKSWAEANELPYQPRR